MKREPIVVWDWNGTLLDDVEACVASLNVMLARRDMPAVSVDAYRDAFEFPVRNYYLTLGFDFAVDAWEAVAVEYHDLYVERARRCRLREGARELLRLLAGDGRPMYILSACERSILEDQLARWDVAPYVRAAYGLSDLYASSKVDIGRRLLADQDLDPADCLLVGDTVHDHEVADALGMAAVLVTGGHQCETKLRAGPRRVVETLAEAFAFAR